MSVKIIILLCIGGIVVFVLSILFAKLVYRFFPHTISRFWRYRKSDVEVFISQWGNTISAFIIAFCGGMALVMALLELSFKDLKFGEKEILEPKTENVQCDITEKSNIDEPINFVLEDNNTIIEESKESEQLEELNSDDATDAFFEESIDVTSEHNHSDTIIDTAKKQKKKKN